MATKRNAEHKARLVLEMFAHFEVPVGGVVTVQMQTSFAAQRRIPLPEIAEGIQTAYDRGWVDGSERNRSSIVLTESGFAEMPD